MSWRQFSLSLVFVDELHFVCAEIGAPTPPAFSGNSFCDVSAEFTGQRAGAAVRAIRTDVEADPPDDVVARVRARTGEQAVHREEHFLVQHGVQRGAELRVVEV